MNHPEQQYLDLMQSLLDHGDQRMDRTGVGTYSDFGRTLRFDLSQGQTPVFTTKRVAWRHALKEMLWFLRGETNIRSLLQGEPRVTIWSDWPHRRYVEETGDEIDMRTFEDRILEDVEFARNWGDLGPVYGKQWRRWMGADGVEHDQVEDALAQIRDNPGSRRIIVEGWNVGELAQMTLPPCHKTYQFWVSSEGRLSLMLTQRSADVLLGVPFNMVGASVFLTIMAAKSGWSWANSFGLAVTFICIQTTSIRPRHRSLEFQTLGPVCNTPAAIKRGKIFKSKILSWWATNPKHRSKRP